MVILSSQTFGYEVFLSPCFFFSCKSILHLFAQVLHSLSISSFAATDHCSDAVPFEAREVQTLAAVSDPFSLWHRPTHILESYLHVQCFRSHRLLLGILLGLHLHTSQPPISSRCDPPLLWSRPPCLLSTTVGTSST